VAPGEPALPGPVRLGPEVCGRLDSAERCEWWLANGRGAYGAGTLAGTLTRRYHGLLIAPLTRPLGRFLVLAKADATLVAGGQEWPLFANRWVSGAIDPDGQGLVSFRLDGRVPVWHWSAGGLGVEQRIWLEQGEDRVWVAWRLLTPTRASSPGQGPRLRVALLANARDHHSVTQVGQAPEPDLAGGRLRLPLPGGHRLVIEAQGGTLTADRTWIEGLDLPLERERGLEDRDNHLRVGWADLGLDTGDWVGVSAWVDPGPGLDRGPLDLDLALARRLEWDLKLIERARQADPCLAAAPDWVDQLVLAADSFLFARPLAGVPDGESVIAGYPWFGDWGRDTMIALPGLTLATGRPERARRILETFARFVDAGMLPNCFPGAGESAQYNTVDAALWYLEAWRALVECTGDWGALGRVFPVLDGIVSAYRDGTRYGIRMDPEDGLIRAGAPGVQLTWMDAKVGDWVVTPRSGKPVEIAALWYNGLCAMAGFAAGLGLDPGPYEALARRTALGFRRFVRPDGLGLYDLLDGPGGADARLRPNQIFAVSLTHSPLDPLAQAQAVAACRGRLLTPWGLRSLAPEDPDYRGRYLGGVWARDGAYHQGTVWGWLLGPYVLAEYRTGGDLGLARSRLAPLAGHLLEAGLGTVGELFDGDPPHAPRGAPAQAWSVATVLEAWWRLSRAGGPYPDRPQPGRSEPVG
jgi:4-alpha-glucanotransferase